MGRVEASQGLGHKPQAGRKFKYMDINTLWLHWLKRHHASSVLWRQGKGFSRSSVYVHVRQYILAVVTYVCQ